MHELELGENTREKWLLLQEFASGNSLGFVLVLRKRELKSIFAAVAYHSIESISVIHFD
jgi:hypothetical protein